MNGAKHLKLLHAASGQEQVDHTSDSIPPNLQFMSSQILVYYVRYISVLLIGSTNLGFCPVEAWIFPQSLVALDFCVCALELSLHM